MYTHLVEFPEALAQKIQNRGYSAEALNTLIVELLNMHLRDQKYRRRFQSAWRRSKRLQRVGTNNHEQSETVETSLDDDAEWLDPDVFVRNLIENNRRLFEELARL